MIFGINMDGKLTRKSRLVAGVHTTLPPSFIAYPSVVSRESVRISFLHYNAPIIWYSKHQNTVEDLTFG